MRTPLLIAAVLAASCRSATTPTAADHTPPVTPSGCSLPAEWRFTIRGGIAGMDDRVILSGSRYQLFRHGKAVCEAEIPCTMPGVSVEVLSRQFADPGVSAAMRASMEYVDPGASDALIDTLTVGGSHVSVSDAERTPSRIPVGVRSLFRSLHALMDEQAIHGCGGS